MKKLRGSLFAKIVAIFLLTVLAVGLVFSAAGIVWMININAYSADYQTARSNALDNLGRNHCNAAGHMYAESRDMEYPIFYYSDTNFLFSIYDQDGKLLFKGYSGEDTVWAGSELVPVDVYNYEDGSYEYEYLTVKGYILKNMVYDDELKICVNLFAFVYALRTGMIIFAVTALLLCIFLFIFLMCAAGHRDGSDTITKNALDRIPFDLFTAIAVTVFCLLIIPVFGGWLTNNLFIWILAAAMLIGAFLTALAFFMSFATRMKAGSFTGLIKSCIIYKILSWCWKIFKMFWREFARLLRGIPILGRWGFAVLALLIVEFIVIIATDYETGTELFFWFIERAVLVALLLYALLCVNSLRKGTKELASGNDGYKIDSTKMRGVFREHAEDLNNIGTGISRAVNERMKSERFRTELITNVSHDIKTPLTSIINYVDLIGKEEPESEKMREYIDVLSRQSARLKKLIDDLIEASKASTGNLNVNLQRCELGVLLDQTAGEYGERLSKAGLELVLTKPEEAVTIMADGRHIWRIFDNLMNNACKYAQPGTRIYLTLNRVGNTANVIFRNISRTMLNITGDELMERFVRGDSSRNTEGSGLGLNIAKSLAQLQGGEMELTLDGDLFKVTLSFPTVE